MPRNPYDVALENVQYRFDNGQLSREQYQQMVANFTARGGRLPPGRTSGTPNVQPTPAPTPTFVLPAHLIPTIAAPPPSPAQIAAERAEQRARMAPTDLLAEYLRDTTDSPSDSLPPVFTPLTK